MQSNSSHSLTLGNTIIEAKGWENTLRALMLAGKQIPLLPENLRTQENMVHGCESVVWLTADLHFDSVAFYAFSDSKIIRGVLAILLEPINNKPTNFILSYDLSHYMTSIGLERYLSQSRGKGIKEVIKVIKNTVK